MAANPATEPSTGGVCCTVQQLLQQTCFCANAKWRNAAVTCTGGVEVLMGHSEVVMCDFAACLLAELERWMLNASPAMIDLNSFADNSDYFSAPTSALEEVSKRLYSDVVCSCCCETTSKLCVKIAPVLHQMFPVVLL